MKTVFRILAGLLIVVAVFAGEARAEAVDCNSNSIDDSSALENDCNGNSIPDECDVVPQAGFVPTDRGDANVVDMNLDGTRDAIDFAANPFNYPIALRLTLNLPGGGKEEHFSDPCTVATGQFQPRFLGVDETTGDALPDVFVVCDQPYGNGTVRRAVVLQRNLGGGNLSNAEIVYQDIVYSIVGLGDVNDDGAPDILGYSFEFQEGTGILVLNAVFLVNDGTNHFNPSIFPTPETTAISFADLNADGADDIVGYGGKIYWNDGAGNFSSGSFTDLATPSLSNFLDFDGDGKTDIAGGVNGTTNIFYSNGDKTFQHFSVNVSGTYADYNGDGKLDIVSATAHGDYGVPPITTIYLQSSRGVFTRGFYFPDIGMTIGSDIDGDGRADAIENSGRLVQGTTIRSRDENSDNVPDECESNLEHETVHSLWNTHLGMTNVLEL